MIRQERGSGGVSPTVYLPLAGGTMVGNVIFNDNVSVLLGTGSDGNLYHDGTNTYFKNATGGIIIENDAVNGDITFKVNDGGVDTTVMTIDGATSNVGIGTTEPGALLEVYDANGVVGEVIRVKDRFGQYGGISVEGAGANFGLGFWFAGTKWMTLESNGGLLIGSTYASLDAPANGLAIQGNVGIGLTAPTAKLHLPAATAAVNTASLKIPSGVVATTPVAGNIEADDLHIYWTKADGTRLQLDN